jgi:hypothetical protein
MLRCELVKRFMHRQQLVVRFRGGDIAFLDGHSLAITALAPRELSARPINQNPAHRLGGSGKKWDSRCECQ